MSDLQISLIVIGIVIIAGVVFIMIALSFSPLNFVISYILMFYGLSDIEIIID